MPKGFLTMPVPTGFGSFDGGNVGVGDLAGKNGTE